MNVKLIKKENTQKPKILHVRFAPSSVNPRSTIDCTVIPRHSNHAPRTVSLRKHLSVFSKRDREGWAVPGTKGQITWAQVNPTWPILNHTAHLEKIDNSRAHLAINPEHHQTMGPIKTPGP